MFHSFFPNPRLFFPSFLIWSAITMTIWHVGGVSEWGGLIGLPPQEGAGQVADLSFFWTNNILWYYLYYAVCVAIFTGFWFWYSPHKWQRWSVLGSAIIIFTVGYSVQVSVALNNWRGPFFDRINQAINEKNVPAADLYWGIWDFAVIAFVFIAVIVLTRFFTSHYLFRWRKAMTEFYQDNWKNLRHIEGASQRVQEDTQRFAKTVEDLATSAIDAVLTLIAFMPILVRLGEEVTELPIIGAVPYPLVIAAIAWSLFGTVLLVVAGIKLPGLYFNNQKVEAAYRKELVYGEDDVERADPPTLAELFDNVRKNYFRLYFHYMYFNVARYLYLQADNIFTIIILIPSFAAGTLTLGLFQQIASAFGQVSNSFQYLVNSWSTIVELLSIHKRLKAFESQLLGEALPIEDQEYLAEQNPAE
ncbi:MAG: peptide antibiotic transporter SbmA [Pseudomonadota bacterium]